MGLQQQCLTYLTQGRTEEALGRAYDAQVAVLRAVVESGECNPKTLDPAKRMLKIIDESPGYGKIDDDMAFEHAVEFQDLLGKAGYRPPGGLTKPPTTMNTETMAAFSEESMRKTFRTVGDWKMERIMDDCNRAAAQL